MSSTELAEAGVLGLEDDLVAAESDSLSEPTSDASVSETKASDDDCSEAATGADTAVFQSRPDLLTELRKVHILDELIMEENLQIHALRRCKENPDEEVCASKSSDTSGPASLSKERDTFRLQLEKEKMEVDKLEKSLGKEFKVKKDKDRDEMKCSLMEKARTEDKEDRALSDELLSGSCNGSTPLVQGNSQAQDPCTSEHIQAVLGPDVVQEATPQDLVPLADYCPEAEPSSLNGTTLVSTSDLKEPPEEVEAQRRVRVEEFDRSSENAIVFKPEASLTPETRPDDGAFDPGGRPHLPPVPKPRKALLPAEQETPHSTELHVPAEDAGIVQLDLQDEPLDVLPENVNPAISPSLVLSANVKEHSSNNNNNNHAVPEIRNVPIDHRSGITSEDEEATSEVPACLLQTAEEIHTSSPADERTRQQPPQHPSPEPLEFEPSGRDEQSEDLSHHGAPSSEAVRISGSGSAGIQAQLDISMRQVQSTVICVHVL